MDGVNNVEARPGGLDQAVVAKIETIVEDTMQENKVPGISIGIVKNGLVEYSSVFGVADVETQQPVTSKSVYVMMSVAKQFVATAIMQLVERGIIDLNAHVIDYLPYFALADLRYKNITIRQMLTHTSGMPGPDMPSIIGWWQEAAFEEDGASAERYVRSMSNISLQSEPGKGFSYSDINFDVLGQVITEVSKQSFEDYMREHIFVPLGMKHSTFLMADVSPQLLVQPHVVGEEGNAVKADVFPYTRWHVPSTDLFSNVHDMTRWMLVNLNGGELEGTRILDELSHRQMWTEQTAINDERSYGYGWFLSEFDGRRIISHGGADLGFHADVVLIPDENFGIVAMGNCFYSFDDMSNFYMFNLTSEVMKIVLDVKDSE